ncbi:MAG: FAD-binding oxidoreductase [Chitinophagaceae bacterium]
MNNKTYIWKTSSVLKETGDTMTIIFETDGECFTYKAGQFLNVQQKIGEEIVSRSYSLSSSPAADDRPAITIKKVKGGKMGNHVFQNFESIQNWKLNGPLGAF